MLGIVERIAASVEDETTCSTDGEQNSDVDCTNSSGDIDSQQVEAARLAAESVSV